MAKLSNESAIARKGTKAMAFEGAQRAQPPATATRKGSKLSHGQHTAKAVPLPKRAEDIANIFSTLKKPPTKEVSVPTDNIKRSSKPTVEAVPGAGDGLYREKAPDIDMNDAEFFGDAFTDAVKGKKKTKKSGAVARKHNAKEMDGLHRMMTEEEVLKITSSNPNAGSTPNCPFDCDCCF